ncbi:MAG: histidine phosphatase family protein [Pseudomonadota bacterium]
MELWLWRHPRCPQAAGRCIGRTDLPLDARRAKRLAHRLRATARREGLPRQVWTSPLQRCRAVGRWLRRWGWRHHVHPGLLELDFGHWEGRRWHEISSLEVTAWEADFLQHRPGGGESLASLMARLQGFMQQRAQAGVLLVVAHAGCMQVLRWWAQARSEATASRWPVAPPHGRLLRLALPQPRCEEIERAG